MTLKTTEDYADLHEKEVSEGMSPDSMLKQIQELRAIQRRLEKENQELRKAVMDSDSSKSCQCGVLEQRSAVLAKLCIRLRLEIQERKRIEKQLSQSELHYRNLVETMNGGLAIQDENGFITYMNDKLSEMTGYAREEILGRSVDGFLQMLDETSRKTMQEQMGRRRKGEAASYELSWTRKDGRNVNVIVSPKPLFDEKGFFRGSFALVTDITELKRAEETVRIKEQQLECLSSELITAQEKERRRISMELHDELGQALIALKLQAGSIERKLPPSQQPLREECRQMIAQADEIVDRIHCLSSDLCPLILDDLGLTSSLRWMLNDFERRAGIECSADIEEVEQFLDPGSRIMVYRILQECLTNIAKHAEAKHVSVHLKRQGENIFFLAEDDGKGFDTELLPHSCKTKRGFGLTIMSERIRMLGGSFEIRSRTGSTTISFTFPLKRTGAE